MPENQQNTAAIAEAWNTTTPYDQIKTGSAFERGQYDFVVQNLTPGESNNGLYTITIQAKALAPSSIANLPGNMSIFTRTLYVGSNKDKHAKLPETRMNNSALGFLKKIAEANKLPSGSMPDAQMCQQLLGKQFGVALVQGKPYASKTETNADGSPKMLEGGLEFGRTVTSAGTLPAKLEREASAATTGNGHAAAGPTTGSVFA